MSLTKDLSSIEDIITDAKAGKMFILVDDEDRENEGDLIIPAEMADAQAINFMAKHGRGLICLALTKTLVNALGLPPMSMHNRSRHQTAFTVSIEASSGISTGISAKDRATTIAAAINDAVTSEDIHSPGHVFPLEARDGGVLVRAGHTEAAVDIAQLAGLKPAGVICEIMKDDGEMARLPDLIDFAKQHDLRIATIADLIAYRRRNESLVKAIHSTAFHSHYGGAFEMHIYQNTLQYAEHIALVKGEIHPEETILVRMHSLNVLNDVLGDTTYNKQEELHLSMQRIADEGTGVLVLIREPKPDMLSSAVMVRDNPEKSPKNLRDYGIGAQILLDIGVRKIKLLTNSPKSVIGLEGYDLELCETLPIE